MNERPLACCGEVVDRAGGVEENERGVWVVGSGRVDEADGVVLDVVWHVGGSHPAQRHDQRGTLVDGVTDAAGVAEPGAVEFAAHRRHRPVVDVGHAGPAAAIGAPVADGEADHGVEVGGDKRRLAIDPSAVEPAAPSQRHGGGAPPSPEQRPGDGGDRVGVAAGAGRPAQRGREVVAGELVLFVHGDRDGGEGGLEGSDDPPIVVLEVCGFGVCRLGDASSPQLVPRRIDVVEAGDERGAPVEPFADPCRRDRLLDGQ